MKRLKNQSRKKNKNYIDYLVMIAQNEAKNIKIQNLDKVLRIEE